MLDRHVLFDWLATEDLTWKWGLDKRAASSFTSSLQSCNIGSLNNLRQIERINQLKTHAFKAIRSYACRCRVKFVFHFCECKRDKGARGIQAGGIKKKNFFEVQVLTAVTHFDAIIPHPAPTCVSLLDANYLPVLLLCIFLNHCYRVKRKKKTPGCSRLCDSCNDTAKPGAALTVNSGRRGSRTCCQAYLSNDFYCFKMLRHTPETRRMKVISFHCEQTEALLRGNRPMVWPSQ